LRNAQKTELEMGVLAISGSFFSEFLFSFRDHGRKG
jgi:hypothetical protein